MNHEGVLIYSYTRAQAIADGVLIDVSNLAKAAGFRFPVAMTATVWETCVRVPEGVEGQDETGRLWDVLNVLRFRIRASRAGEGELPFEVLVRSDNRRPQEVKLKAVCGPGDDAEPVITVMLPEED